MSGHNLHRVMDLGQIRMVFGVEIEKGHTIDAVSSVLEAKIDRLGCRKGVSRNAVSQRAPQRAGLRC